MYLKRTAPIYWCVS